MEDLGLVSIVMPNYNGEKYIAQAIGSVIEQTYPNWELLVVDDCSSDKSVEIVKGFLDERIKLIQNEQNSGAAKSRNNAIKQAKGRWIAFLDSDDTWKKDKLEKQIAFMYNGGYALSFTHYEVVDDQDEKVTVFCPTKDEYDYKTILKHCYIGCLTAIYDKEQVGEVLMPEQAIKREDYGCWLSILKRGYNAYCLHADLATYRVHSGSDSANKFKMIKYQWNVYRNVEKINFFKCGYYMMHWAIKGFFKYKK